MKQGRSRRAWRGAHRGALGAEVALVALLGDRVLRVPSRLQELCCDSCTHHCHCSACKYRNSCVEQFWKMVRFRNTSAVVRFYFFFLCSPSPSSSLLLSLHFFFFFLYFPLAMNDKTPRISLQTHTRPCVLSGKDRESQRSWQLCVVGDNVVANTWSSTGDRDLTEHSCSSWGMQRGYGFTLAGSTFLCSWNCEP